MSEAWRHDGVGDSYRQSRPAYPDELSTLLPDLLNLTASSIVLDIGSGPSPIGAPLSPTTGLVAAVDVSVAMLAGAEATSPIFCRVASTAEQIAFRDGCADAAIVANAFHWFDAERAVPEMGRALRSGAVLAVLWYRPYGRIYDRLVDVTSPWRARNQQVSASSARFTTGQWRAAIEQSGLFGVIHDHRIATAARMNRTQIRGWVRSWSHISVLEGAHLATAMQSVDTVLADNDSVTVPHTLDLHHAVRT